MASAPRLALDLGADVGAPRDAQHPAGPIVDRGDHDPVVEAELVDGQRAGEPEPVAGGEGVEVGGVGVGGQHRGLAVVAQRK
jgi:hypothetical protein